MEYDLIKEILAYDPQTGIFTRNINMGKFKAGTVCGTVLSSGYTQISINGSRYYAHVLAYYYMTEYYPNYPLEEVDHINGDNRDNRFCNLRLSNKSQNGQNKFKPQSNNKSGTKVPGVSFCKRDKVYTIRLKINGKLKNCGSFKSLSEAENTCLDLRRKYYEYNNL